MRAQWERETNRSAPALQQGALWPRLVVVVALAAMALAYILLAVQASSVAYLDYVDGYYLYAAHRMAEGAVLYRQVMGVQPPGIYVVGSVLFHIHDSLAVARWYAAALHVATMLLVCATAYRVSADRFTALIAALLYSVAPYSLVWSRLFDPNPLVTCLSLGSFLVLLQSTRRSAALSGALGALALAVKVWYIPVGLAMLLYLVHRRREQLRSFLVSFIAGTTLWLLLGTLSAGGAFWHGLLAQDTSGLSLSWLTAAVYDVVQHDWPLLLLAWAGRSVSRRLAVTAFPAITGTRIEALGWYAVSSAAVVGATVKVGTFAPVFQFAEPGLAMTAALFIGYCRWSLGAHTAARARAVPRGPGRSGSCELPALFALLAVLGFWAAPSVRQAGATSDRSVRAVTALIERASFPGERILAPPWYLYLSGRRSYDLYADVNLWAEADAAGDRAALAATRSVVDSLRRQALPLVVMDNRVQRLPGVQQALRMYYRRLPYRDTLPADRAVTLWVPSP